jgi:hypothetical protein
MYDLEIGFSILDYHLKQENSWYNLSEQIIDLIGFNSALTTRKFEALDYNSTGYKEKEAIQRFKKYEIFLPMVVRFLHIMKDRYPNILSQWQKQHEENKKNPNMRVLEMVERSYIPQSLKFEPYLKDLEEMGY